MSATMLTKATVIMRNGQKLNLMVDVKQMARAFPYALTHKAMLEIENPEGRVLAINPMNVVYWTTGDV